MPKSDPLKAYRKKRSADRTPEPFGVAAAADGRALRFVVQQHAARRLHYDLRLEMDGVLRSWAVPKGPSPNPADKRLAVRTEDHPLEYANFEGQIPPDNYGAGTVIVWDRGRWLPLNDPHVGLEQGKLLFELRGYKLRGRWTLVKTKQDWLLIKEHDGYVAEAGTAAYPTDSILSGHTVATLSASDDPGAPILRRLKRLGAPRKRVAPARVKVMLAKSARIFSAPGWLFEIKYDGYRILACRDGGDVQLYSRAGNDLTATFPEIAETVAALPHARFILDGEAVVHDDSGLPSFANLQRRGRLTRRLDIQRASLEWPAAYYAFDLLAFNDYDVRPLPLRARKDTLRDILPSVGPIRYSDHIEAHGETMFDEMTRLGVEGVVAKRADARYTGGRSASWLKIVGEQRDDFAVIGYTYLKDDKGAIGALLLGQLRDAEMVYSGRVGTGFSHAERVALAAELGAAPPAAAPLNAPADQDYRWVAPALVGEVRFKERTRDGLLRAPVFIAMRDDKTVAECVSAGELPEHAAAVDEAQTERLVDFTNRDKVFWPDDGYTKGDLIDYYRAISPWLLPYLKDRPLVLDRYPDGIAGKSFYQKDAPGFAPDWLRIETLWSNSSEREIRYFIVDDAESLAYLANSAAIPLHVWSSRVDHLERPDWCILDLDPKGAPFADVVTIARAIHDLCDEIALPHYVKTSGSAGLHVMIPLKCRFTYEQSRTLGELLARVIVMELPHIATIARSLSAREGRVYIDYVQNGHGRLIVAPFSVRPLAGAPVSMPLRWSEVTQRLNIGRYTIKNAVRRLQKLKSDPLLEIFTAVPDLDAALARLGERFPLA